MDEKKINRDFIKGGRGGGGHHFMKGFPKKSFFSRMRASLIATTLVFACYLYQFWQSGNLKVSYVLGKHPWTVSNNGYECHEGHSYTTQVLDDVWINKNQRKAIFS